MTDKDTKIQLLKRAKFKMKDDKLVGFNEDAKL